MPKAVTATEKGDALETTDLIAKKLDDPEFQEALQERVDKAIRALAGAYQSAKERTKSNLSAGWYYVVARNALYRAVLGKPHPKDTSRKTRQSQ